MSGDNSQSAAELLGRVDDEVLLDYRQHKLTRSQLRKLNTYVAVITSEDSRRYPELERCQPWRQFSMLPLRNVLIGSPAWQSTIANLIPSMWLCKLACRAGVNLWDISSYSLSGLVEKVREHKRRLEWERSFAKQWDEAGNFK